ncbi:MAG: HDOD domain-containing protein [Thiobacillaceae bacterium]
MNTSSAGDRVHHEGQETIRLLERLSADQDFPAFSQVIAQVNRITAAEDSHAEQLTDTILKDVALTNKLLRLVNSAKFGFFGNQPIGTISRAVIILGYDTVRDAALSLMLFEHLQNHAQTQQLKAETIDSFYCGVLGRVLARKLGYRDTEEVFICALFRNLGKLMARLHFFAATREVEALVQTQGLSEEQASRRVLGMSYDEIGQAVARHWKLPARILEGMSPLPDGPVKPSAERHQVLANLSLQLYEAVKNSPGEEVGRAVTEIARRYEKSVNLPGPLLVEAIYQASEVAEKEVAMLQTDARQSPLLRKLLDRRTAAAPAAEAKPDIELSGSPPQAGDANAVLIDGLQELTNLLLEHAHPKIILQVGAELLFRTGGFDNVIICTVDPDNQFLAARIGHGGDWARLRNGFRVPLAFNPDVFHAAISKAADILISDTGADNIRNRIPDWYRRLVAAKSFLLLPITAGNRCVAMIYADRREAALQLPAQTMGLIKSLRNQLTMALRTQGRI